MKTKSSEFSDTENDFVKTQILLRPHTDFIPDNYIVAEKRLTSLREQLTKDSNLLFEYDKTINDYLSMGIIEKVPLNGHIEPEQFIICHIDL